MSLHDERYRRVIERLVEARRRLGLSQVAVASRLMLDPRQPAKRPPQSFVSKCENRERRLDVVELADFARLYGISVLDLLGDDTALAGASLAREGEHSTGASMTQDKAPGDPPHESPPAPKKRSAKRARDGGRRRERR